MFDLVRRLIVERDVSLATTKAWLTSVRALVRWAGEVTPQEACDKLSEFVAFRSTTGSPYTASFYRRTLVAILRHGEELGLCTLPKKVRRVRIPEHEPIGFTDLEIRLLLSFANPMQRAAILLVRFAALRRGDVFRVRWSQIGGDGVLRLVMGKSGRRHAVYLPPEVLVACETIRSAGDDRLIPFCSNMSSWNKQWLRLGRRSGVNVRRRGLQAIRRSAASLVARDHNEVEAAKLLGHANGSGVNVFRKFYRVGQILDKPPATPPSIAGD